MLGTKARQAAQLTLERVSTPKLSGESKYYSFIAGLFFINKRNMVLAANDLQISSFFKKHLCIFNSKHS